MINEKQRKFDIYDRTFKFAVNVARLVKQLPNDFVTHEYCRQLIRSSSSVGANLEEADGALTKKDFINKIGISRREASESKHWLKLIRETTDSKNNQLLDSLDSLIKESSEIVLILSSIIKNTKL